MTNRGSNHKGKKVKRRKLDRHWFMQQLAQRSWSQRQFATKLGVDPGGLSLLLTGKRELHLDEAQLIADTLKIALPEILARGGVEIDGTQRKIEIKGSVDHSGKVEFVAGGSEDETDGPRDLPKEAFAIQARTHYSKLAMLDRWLIYVSGVKQHPQTLLGQLALCGLKDGKMCMAHVRDGYKDDSVNLHFVDHVQESVQAIWAMRVLWLRPLSIQLPATNGGPRK